jgi:beta-1,4-mannosyltransferase
MPRKHRDVYLIPKSLSGNDFVENFARSLDVNGHKTLDLRWNRLIFSGVLIFHWPDEFFRKHSGLKKWNFFLKRMLLAFSRAVAGLKIVWIVHNIRPHNMDNFSQEEAQKFIGNLDGIIFLSNYSCDILRKNYHLSDKIKKLFTVHGLYDDKSTANPLPIVIEHADMIAAFGQIRPYKNFSRLADIFKSHPDIEEKLVIAGQRGDEDEALYIDDVARSCDNVISHTKSSYLSNEDLHNLIGRSIGVILPYRDILNSGSAILSLSLNKPVLAPSVGSLPELQRDVGSDWLHLYDGDITADIIREFIRNTKSMDASGKCDVSKYQWNTIGRDVSRFIDAL